MTRQADLPMAELKRVMRLLQIQNIQLPIVQVPWAWAAGHIHKEIGRHLISVLGNAACSYIFSVYWLTIVLDEPMVLLMPSRGRPMLWEKSIIKGIRGTASKNCGPMDHSHPSISES